VVHARIRVRLYNLRSRSLSFSEVFGLCLMTSSSATEPRASATGAPQRLPNHHKRQRKMNSTSASTSTALPAPLPLTKAEALAYLFHVASTGDPEQDNAIIFVIHPNNDSRSISLERDEKGYYLHADGGGSLDNYTHTPERPSLSGCTKALDAAWVEGSELDVGGTCWVAKSLRSSSVWTPEQRIAFVLEPVARRLAPFGATSSLSYAQRIDRFVAAPYDYHRQREYILLAEYLMAKTGVFILACPQDCTGLCCTSEGSESNHAAQINEVRCLTWLLTSATRQ
jgi:hypothetical protein